MGILIRLIQPAIMDYFNTVKGPGICFLPKRVLEAQVFLMHGLKFSPPPGHFPTDIGEDGHNEVKIKNQKSKLRNTIPLYKFSILNNFNV